MIVCENFFKNVLTDNHYKTTVKSEVSVFPVGGFSKFRQSSCFLFLARVPPKVNNETKAINEIP